MSLYFLKPGTRYRVSQAFVDFDGSRHDVGEEWTFLRTNFLPYDDGLSVFVSDGTERERQIRMQWRDEAQGPIIDHFQDYLTAMT